MEALFTVIARSMGIEALQVEAVMTLLREGSSVPFIARYRKERTKGLDEEQIRQIEEAYQYQTHLEKRKEDVLRLIDQQGMLDEALRVLADYFSSVTPAVREQPAAAAQPFKNLDII